MINKLNSFPEEIMLLEDFTSLIIFSFFLFGRNLMGKQMFNSFVVWLASSGTLCFLDLPILLSASLLVPLFLNFFCGSESGHALFYSGILRKIAFPVLFLPVNILEVGFWLPRVDRMVEVFNMIKKKCSCSGKRGISIYLQIINQRTENLYRFLNC